MNPQTSPIAPAIRGTYKPIERYGVIGNLHTVALIATDGSIDWCCLPHFDSPSVFGALLDAEKGGRFQIIPTGPAEQRQMYLPDSNILMTRFLSEEGAGEVLDFMPVADDDIDDVRDHRIYRVVRCVRGRMTFRATCRPAFNYGRTPHRASPIAGGALFSSPELTLALHAPVPLTVADGAAEAEFSLAEDETVSFILRHVENGNGAAAEPPQDAAEAFDQTLAYWHAWVGHLQYNGRWRESVTRSALTLKILTYAPTGAIVAAPTTSLPEEIGGVRNWDYRFTWIRDASFTLYALLRLGFSGEAKAFEGWLQERLRDLNPDGSLNIMYGLHGEKDLRETDLNHWEGYRGSRPVRIGNGAHDQLQLDIYGELMDSLYLYDKYGAPLSYDMWMRLRPLLNYVCDHWREPDKGIWEIRSGPKHFVYSKVMCWVALDRALRMATKRSLPADWDRWRENRDAIYREVMEKGWNADVGAFVQHYETTALDASVLILPLVKFIAPTDPRMISTLKKIKEKLVVDSLVHRYEHRPDNWDGVEGREGTFSMCTFWYVEAMARAGLVAEARWVFEKMLGYGNHLGLFAEELGPTGFQLGNYPQAFTHLGLISAAYNLDRALRAPAQPGGQAFSLFGDDQSEPPPRRRK